MFKNNVKPHVLKLEMFALKVHGSINKAMPVYYVQEAVLNATAMVNAPHNAI